MSEILSITQHNEFGAPATSEIGAEGERLAADYLARNGYRLAAANFRAPVGRNTRGAVVTGEVDVVAYDEDVLCFIEVKTRTSDQHVSPLAAVDLRKQRQIIRTARAYRKIFRLPRRTKTRYDAVSVILRKDARPQIELFKNFFGESKFRKNQWKDFGF